MEDKTLQHVRAWLKKYADCAGHSSGRQCPLDDHEFDLCALVDSALGTQPPPAKTVSLEVVSEAAALLHKIATAMDSRYLILHPNLTEPLKLSIAAQHMVDSQVRDEACDMFEKLVLALHAAGDPDTTVRECGAEDITQ